MKPPAFLYAAPESVEETLALLAEYGSEAKLLAGGQSLMPLLNMRLARPAVLIDLNRVKGLDHITAANGEIRIGAMTRQRAAERSPVLASRLPLITDALRWVGHAQIRNRGTVGGSLAHADPAAELPAVAAALDATLMVRGQNGTRALSSGEFFVGYLTTAIEPAEVLTEIRIPVMTRDAGWAFAEISRRHGDFALVGTAAVIHTDSGERCRDVRLAFTGVGPTPVRIREAEAAVEGQRLMKDGESGRGGAGRLDDALLREVAQIVSGRLQPESDIQASAEYRKHVAGVLARRALTAAAARAGGAQ
ncbi:MAG: FAD binding domain-containing protein [Armatimonadota bacterium]